MNKKCTYLLSMLLCMNSLCSLAQNNFIEGKIVYSVKIESVDPKQNKQFATGTLNLFLKGNVVLKELSLSSGFKNKMIFNASEKKAYSLRQIGEEKYALQLDAEQLKKKLEKCAQLNIQDYESDIKSIANFKTEKAKLTCNNNAPIVVYYTKEWLIANESLFEDFPTFNYLPLAYDIKNEDGSIFHFELQKIETAPMDNAAFKIPDGYKVITYEEYKSWRH